MYSVADPGCSQDLDPRSEYFFILDPELKEKKLTYLYITSHALFNQELQCKTLGCTSAQLQDRDKLSSQEL
jgi:hypothetical protein